MSWKLRSEITILFFLVPQIHKQFSCCWPMPGIVVVAEGENFQGFGVAQQRFENLSPIHQIASAVDDSLVPCRGLFLNPFAVSEPANISEVRSNPVECALHFP